MATERIRSFTGPVCAASRGCKGLSRHRQSPVELDKDSSYLVIGATGNIGPHLIRQLADMGAATIVAVSRNPGSRLDDLAASLSATGTTLVTVAADAADETAMSALFDRFGTDLPPLAGIYLAAFGGGPMTLRDMTDDDVTAMFRPKLDVVALLHRLSLACTPALRQFVLFSSISGVTGSRWLAHYAATTTFLDTFAYARRAAGLPATAINWGLWKSLSDSQSDESAQVTLDSGLEPMPDEVAIQALPWVTGPGTPVRSTVVAADWARLATAYRSPCSAAHRGRPAAHRDRRRQFIDADNRVPGSVARLRTDAASRPSGRSRHRAGRCGDGVGVAAVAGSVGGLLPIRDGFADERDTSAGPCPTASGESLPASVVFDYPTVEALTDYLATILPELVEVADQESVDAYQDLTDDELLKELSERLG